MKAVPLTCACLCVLAACAEPPPTLVGIETRVFVDRTDTAVGDPIGVTVEIDTPVGFAVEPPSPPAPTEGFVTESVEALEPLDLGGGLRHRVLWTVRARAVGDHALPELRVPLVHPDGTIQPLLAGGIPLPVRSVRSEFPERDVFFDIREAPAAPTSRGTLVVGAGVGMVLSLLAALVIRHRRGVAERAGADPSVLAQAALMRLPPELDLAPAREMSGRVQTALWEFVEGGWDVPAGAATPDEVPVRVDARAIALLAELERGRFSRIASHSDAVRMAENTRALLRSIARLDQAAPGDVADG
jgi:hypothetical protein